MATEGARKLDYHVALCLPWSACRPGEVLIYHLETEHRVVITDVVHRIVGNQYARDIWVRDADADDLEGLDA